MLEDFLFRPNECCIWSNQNLINKLRNANNKNILLQEKILTLCIFLLLLKIRI